MKKKFINGLLMAALFVGFTSSVISCKDYDDEKLVELQGVLADTEADLRQALETQKAALELQIKNLKDEVEACKTTRNRVERTYATIEQLNELRNQLLNNYYTKEEVLAKINQLIGNLNISQYQTKEQVLALIDDALSHYQVNLDGYVKSEALADAIAALLGDETNALTVALNSYLANYKGLDEAAVNTLIANQLVAVNQAIAEAKAVAAQALELAQANQTNIANLGNTVDNLSNAITGINTNIETINTTIDGINTTISGINVKVENLGTTVENLESTVTSLQTTVNNLDATIISMGEKLDNAIATANEAKAKAEANALVITSLQNSYNELNTKVQGLEGDVAVLTGSIQENSDAIAALAAVVAADEEAADAAHREMLETISGLVSSTDDLRTLLTASVTDLQSQIDAILEKVNDCTGNVNAFFGILDKMITSIVLNGTDNPLFGSLNLPAGIHSNILVAFHGTTGDGINFPTDDNEFYADQKAAQWNVITEKDIEMIGGDLNKVKGHVRLGAEMPIIAMDGAAGNAGTIYLTINPTNRNFTGTTFDLINSQNKKSAVTLEAIQKSDAVLSSIYTRGAIAGEQSDNGFYEAKATLKVEDIDKARLNFDVDGIKEVVKDVRNFRDGIDVANLATSIYNNITDVIELNAVKGTWQDEKGAKSVVSQYDIAAATIKPLTFGFAQEFKFDHIPGLGRVESFLDRLLSKVNIAIPEFGELNFDINSIAIPELTEEMIAKFKIYIEKNVTAFPEGKTIVIPASELPTYTFYNEYNGEWENIMPTGDITVTIDPEDVAVIVEYDLSGEIEQLYGNMTDPVETIKAKLEEFLDDVNEYLGKLNNISVEDLTGNVKSQITRYINALNRRFAKYLNPNKFMQPIMLVKSANGYARLSESSSYAARLIGGTHVLLVPTTYNAEILSPAYKKYVAVTNVTKGGASAQNGNAACKSVLDKANAQNRINEVIDGGFGEFIEFEAEPGYVYEILYSAVDYAGKNVAKKFYLTVNE